MANRSHQVRERMRMAYRDQDVVGLYLDLPKRNIRRSQQIERFFLFCNGGHQFFAARSQYDSDARNHAHRSY